MDSKSRASKMKEDQIKVTGGTLKRKGDFLGDGKEYLEFTPLGAGQEVGRSCHILSYKGITIMLDCGIHPGYSGITSLPFFDVQDIRNIDLLLVSHFHLDHAAALPYFLQKTAFRGRVFMTHPTKAIYHLLLQDFIKISTISADEMLFNEKDLDESMKKIEDINFHQTVTHKGVKFWCLHAGHVLGAAMFVIEIADVRILYTGDYSRVEDRHLKAAEIPQRIPDILIVEATFGVRSLSPIHDREKRFTDIVRRIVTRGGRCLIPVFALGRAQELLLLLEDFWARNPTLQQFPVFYASWLTKQCMGVFHTYTNMMNARIQRANKDGRSPFAFRHVRSLRGRDFFSDDGPCVVLATPGMLQCGFSRELFESWCTDPKNGLVIAGYTVQSTLAHEVLREPLTVPAMAGGELPLKMSVHNVSFTAHADYNETSEFIDILKPKDVILVHGESGEMLRLKEALEKRDVKHIPRISTPKNSQTVRIQMSGRKIAKVVKTLAQQELKEGDLVSGLVVHRDFNYTILDPADLAQTTSLQSWTVEQNLTLPFHLQDQHLVYFLNQMFEVQEISADEPEASSAGAADGQKPMAVEKGEKKESEQKATETKEEEGKIEVADAERDANPDPDAEKTASKSAAGDETTSKNDANASKDKSQPKKWLVHGEIEISRSQKSENHLELKWESNPVNDMVADAIVSLLTSCTTAPGAALQFQNRCCMLNPLSALSSEVKSNVIQQDARLEGVEIQVDKLQETAVAEKRTGDVADDALEEEMVADIETFLRLHYEDVIFDETRKAFTFQLNGMQVAIRFPGKESQAYTVECDDLAVRQQVQRVTRLADSAIHPIPFGGVAKIRNKKNKNLTAHVNGAADNAAAS
eukprot:CAMPEP_0197522852 /NCGR_PEP_ID=MMETSP1318-20131121/7908_1 /TAXON_ID=552666 /ORGANISM="Partenskyella glossopodia, Strain RCC365" /LENGTH=864 /DNA_ID=CAMNT_0043075353 /DNA_START=73 /DNA_END=2667 /DNA_ORIENTATION=+